MVRTKHKALLLGTCLFLGCYSYLKPSADFALVVDNPTEKDALLSTLALFAQEHELRRYKQARAFTEDEPAIVRFRKEHTTYFVTREQRGVSLSVYEASEQCLVIRVFENDTAWSNESLEALKQLESSLRRVVGDRARLMRPPGNYRDTPGEMEEYCVRLGLPDPIQEATRGRTE